MDDKSCANFKCKVMHAGRRNPGYQYTMGGQQLAETEVEKDTGVKVQKNLKPCAQCADAARMAQERVQQRAVRMVSGLTSREYEDRLK